MPSQDPSVTNAGLRDTFQAPVVTNHSNEEAELKIESIENMGSMLELDPACLDRKFKYRWVYKHPLKIGRAKARGYRIVDPVSHTPTIVNLVGDAPDRASDGTITVGDVVLMRTLRSQYIGRRKKLRKLNKERLTGPEKTFRTKAKRAQQRLGKNIKVITDEE